jgi:hypothetical protein
MIVKPSITWLTTNKGPMLINNVGVVLLAMAANIDIYALPSPALAEIQAALDAFAAAYKAAADGGPSAYSLRNSLRLVLVNLMRQLAHYVAVNCKGDMTSLILSGFPPQKPVHTPVGPLAAPQGLVVSHGAVSGELDASANPVFGASTYNWTCTPNTPGGAALTGQSTGAGYTFGDLTPAVTYIITVNAVGAAGISNWSSPVSLIAI